MNLTENLSIHNVDHNKRLRDLYKEIIFSYGVGSEKCKVELSTSFTPAAHTQEFKQVFNFGYGINIYEWNNKYQYYDLLDVNREDGRATKQYIKDSESRQIITKFVHKYINQTLQQFNLPIIMRGPLSIFKQNSPRYLIIDDILESFGYQKVEVKVSDMLSFIPYENKVEDDDAYWFYAKGSITKDEVCALLEY